MIIIIIAIFISFIVFPVLSVTQSIIPTATPNQINNQLPVLYIGIGTSVGVVVVFVTLILLLLLMIRMRKKDIRKKNHGKYDTSTNEQYVIQINGILFIFVKVFKMIQNLFKAYYNTCASIDVNLEYFLFIISLLLLKYLYIFI